MATAELPRTWNLDFYPHPESKDFTDLMQDHAAQLSALVTRSNELASPAAASGTEWAAFLQDFGDVAGQSSDLQSVVLCHASADAQNRTFIQWESQLAAQQPLMEQIVTNIEFRLSSLSDSQFDEFVRSDSGLSRVRFFLEECCRNAQQRLPKEQEILAADLAVDGLHAWGRLYDRISGALRVTVMEKGEFIEKSPGQLTCDSAERTVRENNFHAADRAWHSIGDTCADALNHIAGTRLTLYRHLDFKDQLDVPLRRNRLQRRTLQTMWDTISARKKMLLNYFEAKSRLLGIERMSWFDQTAPLTFTSVSSDLSYDDACRLTVDALGNFDPEFGDFSRRCVEERWVESEDRPGKRQGGFCTPLPMKKESRIFMTFTNSFDSMSRI